MELQITKVPRNKVKGQRERNKVKGQRERERERDRQSNCSNGRVTGKPKHFFSTLELKIHSRNILHKNSDDLIQFGFLEDFLAPLPAKKMLLSERLKAHFHV